MDGIHEDEGTTLFPPFRGHRYLKRLEVLAWGLKDLIVQARLQSEKRFEWDLLEE